MPLQCLALYCPPLAGVGVVRHNAERTNGILKSEFDLYVSQQNLAETQQRIARSIAAYNQIRPHDSCDRLTPEKAHMRSGTLRKRSKNRNQNITNTTCIPKGITKIAVYS